MPHGHGGVLTIDLTAVAANYRALGARASGAETAAAVKADGYGLGLEPVAGALADAGCRTYFVAHLTEAERLRATLPDPSCAIYVLNGLLPGTSKEYARLAARPVLGSLAEIDEWGTFARHCSRSPAVAINIDTGFNRLGISQDEVEILASAPDRLAGINIALLMSHLACADDPSHPMNEKQRRLFRAACDVLPAARKSLANSAGVFLGAPYHFDLVRPGIALYGGRATARAGAALHAVVRLEVPVLCVRDVEKGAVIGYGASYRFPAKARVAIVSIGYADGFLRCLSGSNDRPGGRLFIAGQPVPIVGRVSMDLAAVDVTHIAEHHLFRGAAVEVLGEHQSVDDLASEAGTIGYEILTRLGLRHRRVYSGGSSTVPLGVAP